MNELTVDQFSNFFHELYEHDPYSWQIRLASRAVEGDWPQAIDLPTGSGKTACIDIAVFALACQAGRLLADHNAPRRIFFCVNRRVIVDEAHERAREIAKRLSKAERDPASSASILAKVAAALRRLAGTLIEDNVPPLDVLELRGGIYRDNRWARSAAQPTVVCTTIDQLGSRLLFRGYGVSPNAAPIQAALVAYDSLVLLDEAHISKPFLQSLSAVRGYLDSARWSQEPIVVRPMIVVPMTATPPDAADPGNVIGLDDEDRKNESLRRRLTAVKRTILRPAAKVTDAIIDLAEKQAKSGCSAIGIIVNRVATAREIHKQLRQKHSAESVELVIGAMRPLDRDDQSKWLAERVGKRRPDTTLTTSFVIATQCLEVGADYDFDVLITECASLDALRQRFGRLNRGGRAIQTQAVVVMGAKEIKPDDALDNDKPVDAIYGNAAVRTWNWLCTHADVEKPAIGSETVDATDPRAKEAAKHANETRTIDFGIDAFDALIKQHMPDARIPKELLAPSASLNAPVMLPAHVDFWCQTCPTPAPDPSVALFIHGELGEPDIAVCWRADLLNDEHITIEQWPEVIALLPPTSAECMRVPFRRARGWLDGTEQRDLSDLLTTALPPEPEVNGFDRASKNASPERKGVIWHRDGKCEVIRSPDQLRPGDTLVLPVNETGWDELGHIPDQGRRNLIPDRQSNTGAPSEAEAFADDLAEQAFRAVRGKYRVRLHEWRRNLLPKTKAIKELFDQLANRDDPPNNADLRNLMREAAAEISPTDRFLREALEYFANDRNGFVREFYPNKLGVVLTGRRRIDDGRIDFLPPLDEGDDETSRVNRETPVELDHHTRHVAEKLAKILKLVRASVTEAAYGIAAECHDWGKTDERFQALLRGADRTEAWLFAGHTPRFLAKSDGVPRTPKERNDARVRSGLPNGFRHEILSVQLAERAELPADAVAERDLILHLIAAHHGYARPFAPVTRDDEPPDVSYAGVALSSEERQVCPPERLDSAIADRFWSLVRRYGWWGIAYLESLLRLADQQASAAEDAGEYSDDHEPQTAEASA